MGQSQQPDSSLAELLDRYKTEPANARLCQQIGLAYTKSNDFSHAAEFFRKALAIDPENIPSAKNLATVLWFAGQKTESVAIFRSLEKKIPADPVPQLYLGLHAYDLKDMEPAAAHFERAGALASDNPDVLPFVVATFLLTGRAKQAIDILQIRSGNDPQIYRWLGDAYDRQNLPQKAWDAYSQAIAIAPRVEENYLALAAFAIEHKNASVARDVLARGLSQLPGSAKLTLETGLVWALQGNFDEAKKEFRQASSLDPNWSLPLLALGITDLQTGNADNAAEVFLRAKRIAPDDYRCYYFHALALNRSQTTQSASLRSQAIEELHHAVALDPAHAQARVALAQNQISAGQPTEAEAQLREAIRLDPTQPAALYKLALLCKREGKKQEADRLLTAFASLKKKADTDENEFVLLSQNIR
jgi:tetratricopeptide (TPR) repeat protein